MMNLKKFLINLLMITFAFSSIAEEKILNDHNGFIEFISKKEGAKIKILLPKYVN